MGYKTLKWVQFVVPAVIILVSWSIFGRVTGLFTFTVPSTFLDPGNIIVVILGAIYYASPLRDWANKPYYNEVNENLRTGLVRISGLPERPGFTWKALRGSA